MSVEISILLVHIYYTENLNYISILYITIVQSMEALLGGGSTINVCRNEHSIGSYLVYRESELYFHPLHY